MESLYQISEDILRIFNEVELNEGEITDDQYNALTIKQEELKTKLDAYVKAIKSWEADEKALKEEKKRFNDRQNVFKNRIERLKAAALQAVLNFGEQGKSNMFVELPTCRLFSRASKSVEIDESRISIFMEEFERYVRELVDADVLYAGKDVDLQGILDAINANCRATHGENFEEFTLNDLIALKINVSQTASVYDLFKSGRALQLYGNEHIYTHMEVATSKDDWKTVIDSSKIAGTSAPTMAKVVVNQLLQIK
jgi:hypothetical protein